MNENQPGQLWASAVTEVLTLSAGPVFARAERPAPRDARITRMSALCLAAEADMSGLTDIGDNLRQVAAGIALLEQRAAGKQPANELIILAAEADQ